MPRVDYPIEMPAAVHPATPAELAEALRDASTHKRAIALAGNASKRLMGGPTIAVDVAISTTALARVLAYEPNDLTISVQAGLRWSELTEILAANRQMIPLDPPFAANATVGGVIGANCSGPRRRLYGTARDLVIGMQFATLEGKLVNSGGMVVKNVAGLDMAKLMIGSFGTLAAITVVNFKLTPAPELERSFLLPFEKLALAVAARDRILNGALQPAAIDLLNPAAGASVGKQSWLLAVRAGGNAAAVDRYERELAPLAEGVALEGAQHQALWGHIREFTPKFLSANPDGAVVRTSCTLKEVEDQITAFEGPALARAGSGVCYGYFAEVAEAAKWRRKSAGRVGKAVIEFSPEASKHSLELWPSPGSDFEIMRQVKNLFDPANLLNRGRLYGRI
jgi:glycolate oxidase FAD binding subunit